MANMFSKIIRSVFGNKSNDEVVSNNESSGTEKGKDFFDLMMSKEFVRLESAHQNQEIAFRRATESNRLVLGEILGQTFNV